jgi:hypothetical protein
MADTTVEIQHDEEQRVRELLLGRRVVRVERDDTAGGRFLLDDLTVVDVYPNEGCSGCGSGWFEMTHLAEVDNVITDVRLEETDDDCGNQAYRVFVVADATEINLLAVEGDEGSGCYGAGYTLHVLAPRERRTPRQGAGS